MPDNEYIIYPDSFFADVVNLCGIADIKGETKAGIQIIYNTFKDVLEMNKESRIENTRKKMLCLEHFQLFMHLLHGMHMYYLFRMQESKPGLSNADHSFMIILHRFDSIALKIRNYPANESTWDELENNVPSFREEVWSVISVIYGYCFDEDEKEEPALPPTRGIKMPSSYFEDDEEEKTDEEKFREQQVLQDMEISRMTWAVVRIIIFLEAAVTTCCFVGLGLIMGLVFVSICDQSGKYDLDINYTRCVMMIAAVLGIANIRKIFNYFRENSNDRW